jgi:hypothetical protein
MKVKPYFMIHKPHVHSNEPFHKPHHNNQSSILVPKNTPSSHPHKPYEEHVQSQNNNPNLIPNTSHFVQPTNPPSKTSSTHETSYSSTTSFSSIHDYPNSQISPPPRVSPPPPTNTHAIPMLHIQSSIPNNNHTTPSLPSSEHLKFIEELKKAHELCALLALHLAQCHLE